MSVDIKDETIKSQQHYCRELNQENEKLRSELEKAEKALKEVENMTMNTPFPFMQSRKIAHKYFEEKEKSDGK